MLKGFLFFLKQGWKHDKKYVFWLFALQITQSITPIAAALLPKMVIDELGSAERIPYLVLYVLLFAGWLLISQCLSVFFGWDGFSHRCRVNAAFDSEMHEKLSKADFENLESPAFHDLQEKAQKFLTCDYHGFGYLLDCGAAILGQMITMLGLFAILSTMDPGIVLLFALLAAAASLIESRAAKKAMSLSMETVRSSRLWNYYSELFQTARYGKEIRLSAMADWLLKKSKDTIRKANENIARQNRCYIVSGLKRAGLSFAQQCLAYGVLIFKVLTRQMGLGSFAMCISALSSFADAARTLMDRLTEIRAYDFYYEQLDEYLHVPCTLRSGMRMPSDTPDHVFEFRDVGFRYQGSESWALRHIHLTLRPGLRLALVGENGSGKSTLIKLLCRLYDPTEGQILLDGVDIREYDYDAYLALFSAVFQDFQLFDCSLKENIAFGRPADENTLSFLLKQAGLWPLVSALPQGLETTVGKKFDEQGFEPSGGEAQKIALARALFKNAPVVILDEPTAAMDPRAEDDLYRQFDQLIQNKTALYISHRLSACTFCDQIAVLHQGSLLEYGTHQELMAQDGQYAALYSLQAQYYSDAL